MPSLDEIKIDLQGIGYAIKNNTLAVPKYQRSYAWKEQNITDLFQDTGKAIAEGGKEYFLGSIVISHMNSERPEVVDGQQRLATTTILLAAIRDYFYSHDDRDRAMNIHNDYLVNTDLETLEMIPKLRLNEIDHDFYSKRILSLPDRPERAVEPTKDSHKRLNMAYQLAVRYIENSISLTGAPTPRLIQLVKYFLEKAKIIWVRVPDDANAFTIFETLNDRGLPLAISDLMKNYLFHMSGDRLEEIQQSWISITGTLEAVDSEEIIVTFIRQLWSSKYGSTRERELYQEVKRRITSKQTAIDFASELTKNARLYAAILNTGHDIWDEYGPTAREHMSTLNELGMIQIRPLLLAILDKFSIEEIRKSLKLLVAWSVRFLIYGGLGGGVLEVHYCQRAVEIRTGVLTTARNLLDAMTRVVPTDSEFKNAFENASVSKNFLARYYLRALEKQVRGEAEPELIPNANEEVISLEHILPENPSQEWGNVESEIAATYYKRIGNLALLTRRINSEIGNQGFNAKKQFFQESSYELTRSLSNLTQWGITQIEERQRMLSELAVQTWPCRV